MSDTRRSNLPPEVRDDAELIEDGILDEFEALDAAEDVQNPGELEVEQAERVERHDPELPDRAFDRITPGV